MKKIIVTGCNGQLGRAVNKLYEGNREYELVNTDVAELDITNVDAVLKLAREVKPYAILNCAAYTNVDKCETDIDACTRINAIGPRNLAIASTEVGAKLIHISTDYVFEGVHDTPYTEFDPTGPVSMYGKTKLAGEHFVKDFAKNYFIIRTAWLYGDGKNFVRTMLNLAKDHDTISVVRDQVGSPTSAAELANAIAYLLPTDNYGLFHGTCEGSCAWSDFATEIFRLAKTGTKVNAITTEEYNSPAKRPAYSILENYMLKLTGGYTFADWHDAIRTYMEEEGF
ncbi:MAG: dTDP-4-dehydrorhamnose reductase [Lachnospiraceae bacterium]|nr:dTDP-4-dehydrorhamnose reductase [Lachnospiraceae bacterium]